MSIKFPYLNVLTLSLLVLGWAPFSIAEDQKASLSGISVVGNNEDPRVLYLVPWQPPSISKKIEHAPTSKLQGTIDLATPKKNQRLLQFRESHTIEVETLTKH